MLSWHSCDTPSARRGDDMGLVGGPSKTAVLAAVGRAPHRDALVLAGEEALVLIERLRHDFTLRALATAAVFAISTPVILLSPTWGEGSWIAILPMYLVLDRIYRKSLNAELRPGI
jgi:hypothetical protein